MLAEGQTYKLDSMAWAVHWRFQFGGTLDPTGAGAFDEIWSCTINGVFATEPSDPSAHLAGLQSGMNTWWTGVANKNSNLAKLAWLKLNKIGTDGKFADPTVTHRYDYATPATGNAATGTYTTTQTVAYSWITPNLRGPAHSGRIYVPNAWTTAHPNAAVINISEQNNARDAARALLDVINTTVSGHQFGPSVASSKSSAILPITGVRVGRVVDVQNRRRNKILESYVTGVWPA